MLLVENDGVVSISSETESVIVSASWLSRRYGYPVLNQERRIYKTGESHFTANSAGEEFPEDLLMWDLIENLDLSQLKDDYLDFLNGIEDQPKWKKFRMFFLLGNIAYNRMRYGTTTSLGIIAGGRVEDFINKESTEWAILAGLWDFFVDCTPINNRPTVDEIAEWNAQSTSASMPFRFEDSAKMVLLN